MSLCISVGIPASLVYDIGDVTTQPQAVAMEALVDSGVGPVKIVGPPIRLHRTPSVPVRSAPSPGQHNHLLESES